MSTNSFARTLRLTVACFVNLSAAGAMAQENAVPAELPPASYTGSQYVDSRGCAFVRAGISGRVNWVPRMDRQRNVLCNFQPTLVAGATITAPLPSIEGVEIITVDNAPRARPTVSEQSLPPVQAGIAQIPSQRPDPQMLSARPAPAVAQVAPSPRVVRPAPVAAAPTPRRITLAEACNGRFGVQPGFVSGTTGQPINCGPAPRVASAAVPRVPLVAVTTGPAAPMQTMTMSQICSDISATGRQYMRASSGAPMRCGPQTQPIVGSGQAMTRSPIQTFTPAPVTRVSAPVPVRPNFAAPPVVTAPRSAPATTGPCANMGNTGGAVVRCGPQTISPSASLQASRAITFPATTTFGGFLNKMPMPASNAVVAPGTPHPKPAAGFRLVWDDGRLNQQRGVIYVRLSGS